MGGDGGGGGGGPSIGVYCGGQSTLEDDVGNEYLAGGSGGQGGLSADDGLESDTEGC
jgi:hypothetical protein